MGKRRNGQLLFNGHRFQPCKRKKVLEIYVTVQIVRILYA